jgi:PAS domain S-box-containing protein
LRQYGGQQLATLNQLETMERQLGLTQALATVAIEITAASHFASRCIEQIVRAYGLSVGQYWTVDPGQETLQCSDVWFSLASIPEFRRASKDRRFSKGVGLPGRAWGIGAPIYVTSLANEMGTSFPRKELALSSGLVSGMAFPLRNGTIITGVMEFYSFSSVEENARDGLFFSRLGGIIGGWIEEKHEREKALQVEGLYRQIINSYPSCVVVMDSLGLITHWNQRAEEVLGWSAEEARRIQLGDLIIPERYRNEHNQGLLRYLRTKSSQLIGKIVHAPALTKGGDEVLIEMKVVEISSAAAFVAFISLLDQPREADVTLS